MPGVLGQLDDGAEAPAGFEPAFPSLVESEGIEPPWSCSQSKRSAVDPRLERGLCFVAATTCQPVWAEALNDN